MVKGGGVDQKVWASVSPMLGATLAKTLGLTDPTVDWRGALRAAWRDDETDFDRHPSGRLVHRWLDHGIDGLQLEGVPVARFQRPSTSAPVRLRGVHDLLAEEVPFPRSQRWWLLGTWAAWALLLDALRDVHDRPHPVMLPAVQGDGVTAYVSVRDAWWKGDKGKDEKRINPLRWAGQASGFLQPPRATKNIDLPLDGPLLDVLLVVAHTRRSGRRRTSGAPHGASPGAGAAGRRALPAAPRAEGEPSCSGGGAGVGGAAMRGVRRAVAGDATAHGDARRGPQTGRRCSGHRGSGETSDGRRVEQRTARACALGSLADGAAAAAGKALLAPSDRRGRRARDHPRRPGVVIRGAFDGGRRGVHAAAASGSGFGRGRAGGSTLRGG
jgi:hypothetical protein